MNGRASSLAAPAAEGGAVAPFARIVVRLLRGSS